MLEHDLPCVPGIHCSLTDKCQLPAEFLKSHVHVFSLQNYIAFAFIAAPVLA